MTGSGGRLAPICYSVAIKEFTMHITSPFFVVPVIIGVFAVCILFATSSKEDGHEEEGHSAH
jgi:hypothetical protein